MEMKQESWTDARKQARYQGQCGQYGGVAVHEHGRSSAWRLKKLKSRDSDSYKGRVLSVQTSR